MKRKIWKCLGFASHRRRPTVMFLICSIPAILLLYRYSNDESSMTDVVQMDIPSGVEESKYLVTQSEIVKAPSSIGSSVQDKRHDILLNGCRNLKNSNWLDDWPKMRAVPKLPNSPILSTKTKVLFCLVGKVASSFFTRWVLTMYKNEPMTSPYLIPIEKAGRSRAQSLKSFKSIDVAKNFLDSSTKVVFGRDPFSRIFSAYIDKLYSPNPFYWKYWGEKALRSINNPVQDCGSQITFPQFVKYVTSELVIKDVHLKQVADECNMCEMYYDVIGNLETTVPDLDHVSGILNISSEFQHEQGYKTAALEDVVLDSLKSAFKWKKEIKKCISLDQMGLRIWRKLQIRGVVDSNIQYPFHPGQIENMPVNAFIDACKRAISASTDRNKLKRQKKLAMEEAYLNLGDEQVKSILKAYSLDFELFGYSKEPDYLFSSKYRKQFNKTNFLSWEKPWTLP